MILQKKLFSGHYRSLKVVLRFCKVMFSGRKRKLEVIKWLQIQIWKIVQNRFHSTLWVLPFLNTVSVRFCSTPIPRLFSYFEKPFADHFFLSIKSRKIHPALILILEMFKSFPKLISKFIHFETHLSCTKYGITH